MRRALSEGDFLVSGGASKPHQISCVKLFDYEQVTNADYEYLLDINTRFQKDTNSGARFLYT